MRCFKLFVVITLLLSTHAVAEDVTLDIMSFNIRYGVAGDGPDSWEYRDDLVSGVLQEHTPDIVGLQEALKFQIDAILQETDGYAMLGVGREGDTSGEYAAILYKPERLEVKASGTFWFSDTPDIIGSKSWGNHITRICTWASFVDKSTGRAFYVYNLHLDHHSQPSREESVALLAARIAQQAAGLPFIITGDFNAGEQNKAITFLTGSEPPEELANVLPVRDSFRLVHPEAKNAGTFNGFKGATTGEKIDYVFVSKEVRVLDATILHDNSCGQYPSDHFPVSAQVHF